MVALTVTFTALPSSTGGRPACCAGSRPAASTTALTRCCSSAAASEWRGLRQILRRGYVGILLNAGDQLLDGLAAGGHALQLRQSPLLLLQMG
jgi:hypothetical protein